MALDYSKFKPWELPTAKIGAGAIVLVGERVLLVKLNYGPAKGQWALPGGRVEAGEKIHEAVAREILEETGVVAEPEDIVAVRQRLMPSGLTDIYFLFRARVLRECAEADLKWPREEIQDVRLWDVNEALASSEVRPMARAAIRAAIRTDAPAFRLSAERGVATDTDFVFVG